MREKIGNETAMEEWKDCIKICERNRIVKLIPEYRDRDSSTLRGLKEVESKLTP